MRRLTPGDLDAKLDRIEKSRRSRRWKKAAKRHLLADAGATIPQHGRMVELAGYHHKVCLKRRFPSFAAAFRALIDAQNSPNWNREEQRVYPCHACKAWHLTSKEFDDDRRKESAEAHSQAWENSRSRHRAIIGQGVLRGSPAGVEGRL